LAGASEQITKHQEYPKDSSDAGADSTPHDARAHEPRELKPKPEEIAMNRNRANQPFELTSDMTEIALLVAVSPEIIDRYLAELFGEEAGTQATRNTPNGTGTLIAAIG
jgi:hypothetical protein